MTLHTDLRPDTEASDGRGNTRGPIRVLRPIALPIAIVIAAAAGPAVVDHVAAPATATQTGYHVPNANTREDRFPTRIVHVPNANTREDRVPTRIEPSGSASSQRVLAALHRQHSADPGGRCDVGGR